MIRPFPVLASLALHAAVFTGVMLVEPRQDSAVDEVVPIEFQLVEEEATGESGEADAAMVDATTKVDATTSSRRWDEPTALDELAQATEKLHLEEDSSLRRDEVVASTMGEEERAEVMAPPEARDRIVPVYPKSARRRGREGQVTVEATIAADGSVEDVRVVSSSGYRELDESAVTAVSSARFAPATLAGAVITSTLRLTFDFRLSSK